MKLRTEKATRPLPVIDGFSCTIDLTGDSANRSLCRKRRTPIGSVEADASVFVDLQGVVDQFTVTLPVSGFDELALAVQAKFGKAKPHLSKVRNGLGAEFDQVTYLWVDENGTQMLLQKRGDTATTSSWSAMSKGRMERAAAHSGVKKGQI